MSLLTKKLQGQVLGMESRSKTLITFNDDRVDSNFTTDVAGNYTCAAQNLLGKTISTNKLDVRVKCEPTFSKHCFSAFFRKAFWQSVCSNPT